MCRVHGNGVLQYGERLGSIPNQQGKVGMYSQEAEGVSERTITKRKHQGKGEILTRLT